MRVAVYMYHVVEVPDDCEDIENAAFDEAYSLDPVDFKAFAEYENYVVLE